MGALSTEEDVRLYELAFRWKLLARLGVAPQWERCAVCGQDPSTASGRMGFSWEKGGLLCGGCRSASGSEGEREVSLAPGTARGLAMLLKLPFPKLRRLRLSEEEVAMGERLLREFVAHHLRPVPGAGTEERATVRGSHRRA